MQPGKDHAYVIPSDALRLIQRGVLDRRLFDVADLVEQGYDDGHRRTLPLLVSTSPAPRTVPGLRTTRVLPRTGLTAMQIDRGKAGKLWKTLRTGGTRIWLDAKVHPVLDKSVPQIGAPAAWQAGYTGRGQTVAVLDTGYDAGHGSGGQGRRRPELHPGATFRRTEPSWRLSTAVNATWSVRSEGDGVLPLMAIRYRPRVGPDGAAPGNTAYELPVRVERERGVPDVRRLTVKVSYDDGQTWRAVPVHRTTAGWCAMLTHPATGYVSLQAQATDAEGNTADQTIIRAYTLR